MSLPQTTDGITDIAPWTGQNGAAMSETTQTTEEAIPPKCVQEIYEDGTLVLMTHTIRSWNMEKFVKMVAILSGQPVDWHFRGGRALVKALGDLSKVRQAIDDMKSIHDKMQTEDAHKSDQEWGRVGNEDFTPEWYLPTVQEGGTK